MAFTRWDPLRDLLALHEQIGQLVGSDAPGWNPPVDLFETPRDLILSAEVPGLERDQIEIQVERGHGHFSRASTLPESIDVDRVSAVKNGVLTVTLPKAAGRGSRTINVT